MKKGMNSAAFIRRRNLISKIKGAIGMCQCYGCHKRAVTQITFNCSWGKRTLIVCEDCYFDI